MKKWALILTIIANSVAWAQSTVKDLAVPTWAQLHANGSATLRWTDAGHKNQISILKKLPDARDWTLVTTLADTAKQYTINATDVSAMYEWRVSKNFINASNQTTNFANGYQYVGNKAEAIEWRGHCLVLISKTAYDSLRTDIETALDHIVGDGWQVDTLVVSESVIASEVKAKIVAWHGLHPGENHSLFILGHVAVPYSGLMTDNSNGQTFPADGHTPDHDGAWVCDGYYADMDGIFTDNGSNTGATRAANKNNAGDGKWDQINLPTPAEIEVGRVDFYDLPALGTEVNLLRRYLKKLETYKTGEAEIPLKTLIDDRLGYFGGEGPGRAAHMYMQPIAGQNIETGNLITLGRKNKYLFSQEVSTGSYTQYVNIASTTAFKDSFNAVFNSCFGSYFGDWDVSNNILRAAAAAPGFSLTNCWNGRPMLLFHHMALGKNIGYSVRTMLNNGIETTTYPVIFALGRAHVSLIGDPTLRIQMIKPATNTQATAIDGGRRAKITWTASTSAGVIGYNIYRSTSRYGKYTKVNSAVVAGSNFTDPNPSTGSNYYQVRALKLDSNASGTYYNMSIGSSVEVTGITNNIYKPLEMTASITPNPSAGLLQIQTYNSGKDVVKIEIYNLQGKQVLTDEFIHSAIINLDLTNGIYIVKLKTNNFAPFAKKIVIVK